MHPNLTGPERPARAHVLPMIGVAAGVTVLRGPVAALFGGPLARTWVTLALSVVVQALPFLVLGVVVSSAIVAFVPSERLAGLVPRRTAVAVPIAGLAGMALPGCECGSVVVAGRLVSGGMPPGPAVAFLLSAPAVNPVVLVATAVAFPGQPRVVLARLAASLATALVAGSIWGRFAPAELTARQTRASPAGTGTGSGTGVVSNLDRFRRAVVEDVLHAGGFLVIGSVATATMQVTLHPDALGSRAASGPLGIAVLAAMAVVLCVCSEADAFVAGSLTQFSMTARLVFMVVGPVVDLKLVALHAATFGPRFLVRFEPLVLCTAVCAAVVMGTWLT